MNSGEGHRKRLELFERLKRFELARLIVQAVPIVPDVPNVIRDSG